MSTSCVSFFNIPVGCPRTVNGSRPSKEFVSNWLNNEGKNVNPLCRESFGTYAGIGAALFGIVGVVCGFVKDSPLFKWSGLLLAAVGAGATFIGKMCGFDLSNLFSQIENKVLYSPPTEFVTTPQKEGITHEELTIKYSDGSGEVHGYYIPAPQKTNKTVIYLHGRANNISNCLGEVKELQQEINANVLIMDYRGFGKSKLKQGAFITHESIMQDAKTMYDYLIKKGVKPEDISLFGHSLGGGVAVELSTLVDVHGLHVQSSFTNINDVVKENLYGALPETVIKYFHDRNEFNSIENIKKSRAKQISIGYSGEDEIIPKGHSQKLFESAQGNKVFMEQKKAKHGDYWKHFSPEQKESLRQIFGVSQSQEKTAEKPQPALQPARERALTKAA